MPGAPLTPREAAEALSTVDDPEVGLDVVTLGLVYGLDVSPEGHVQATLTLTTPACPMGGMIRREVVEALRARGFSHADVEVVWSPPWSPAMVDLEARRALFGYR